MKTVRQRMEDRGWRLYADDNCNAMWVIYYPNTELVAYTSEIDEPKFNRELDACQAELEREAALSANR